MTPQDFSHKMSPARAEKFSIEDFGSIAAELDAPPGWPFLGWDEADAYRSFKALIDSQTARKSRDS